MSSSCTLRVWLGFRKPSGFVFCCCVTGHHALGRHRGSGALARLCGSHSPHAAAALAPAGETSPDTLGPPQDCVAGRFLFLAFPLVLLVVPKPQLPDSCPRPRPHGPPATRQCGPPEPAGQHSCCCFLLPRAAQQGGQAAQS